MIGLVCLTPLQKKIFQLYRCGQFTGEGNRRKPRPAARHLQILSHNVVHIVMSGIRTHNISSDMNQLYRY